MCSIDTDHQVVSVESFTSFRWQCPTYAMLRLPQKHGDMLIRKSYPGDRYVVLTILDIQRDGKGVNKSKTSSSFDFAQHIPRWHRRQLEKKARGHTFQRTISRWITKSIGNWNYQNSILIGI